MSNRRKSFSALREAIFLDNPDMVHDLLKAGIGANTTDKTGMTPLIRAAGQKSSVRIVQLLLDFGADVNHADIDGFTALMCAAGAGSVDAVKLLVSKGATVDKIDTLSRTALSWAMTKADVVNVVKALLDLGADPNHIDATGVTPLMRAALLQFPRSFHALLQQGADTSVKHTESGKTAFDMAMDTGNPSLIRCMKEFLNSS